MLGAGLDLAPSASRSVRGTAAPVAALDLNFLYGILDPRITFARASAAWIYDGTTLTSYGTNAARMTTAGLLVEEARTNLMLGSAAPVTQDVTVTAAAHTLSFYGTGTVTLTGASTAGPLVGTGATNRVSLTFTPTAGTLTLTVSDDVRYANLELGSFATSAIVTVGSTVTRAVDSPSITTLTPWFNATEGTLYAEARYDAPASVSLYLASFDTSTATRMGLQGNAGAAFFFVRDGGATQAGMSSGTVTQGAVVKLAGAYKAADFAVSGNGAAVTTDTSGTVPAVTTLWIGRYSSATNSPLCGYVRRFRYYASRLPDATLQALTA